MRLTRYLLARPLVLMPLGAALLATTAGGFVTGDLELTRWIVVALLLIPLIDLLAVLIRGGIGRWNRLIGAIGRELANWARSGGGDDSPRPLDPSHDTSIRAIGREFDKWLRFDGDANNPHRPLNPRRVFSVLMLALMVVGFLVSSLSTPSGSSSTEPGSIGTLPSMTDRWAARTEGDLRRAMDALKAGDNATYTQMFDDGRWRFIEPGTPAIGLMQRGKSVKARLAGGPLSGQEYWVNSFDFIPEGLTETIGQPNTVPYDYEF